MSQGAEQEQRYLAAVETFGAALARLARGYEADAELRRDLLQEMHVALWRSLAGFDGRCSLRTWVYRVAHNIGGSHIVRQKTHLARLATLDDLDWPTAEATPEEAVAERQALERLMAMIHRLKPPDRQVLLLYLDDFDAAAIAEVTGLSAGAVANRIYRVKALLAAAFSQADPHDA